MKPGEDEDCTLRITNLKPGTFVEVSTNLRKGFKSSIKVDLIRGITDANGKIEFTINAVRRGIDWASWAVANEDGKFEFDKKAYHRRQAWGMFVQVK